MDRLDALYAGARHHASVPNVSNSLASPSMATRKGCFDMTMLLTWESLRSTASRPAPIAPRDSLNDGHRLDLGKRKLTLHVGVDRTDVPVLRGCMSLNQDRRRQGGLKARMASGLNLPSSPSLLSSGSGISSLTAAPTKTSAWCNNRHCYSEKRSPRPSPQKGQGPLIGGVPCRPRCAAHEQLRTRRRGVSQSTTRPPLISVTGSLLAPPRQFGVADGVLDVLVTEIGLSFVSIEPTCAMVSTWTLDSCSGDIRRQRAQLGRVPPTRCRSKRTPS